MLQIPQLINWYLHGRHVFQIWQIDRLSNRRECVKSKENNCKHSFFQIASDHRQKRWRNFHRRRPTKFKKNWRERIEIKPVLQVARGKNLQNPFSKIRFFLKKLQIMFSEPFIWLLSYSTILSWKKKSEEICNFTLKKDVNKPMSIERTVRFQVFQLWNHQGWPPY